MASTRRVALSRFACFGRIFSRLELFCEGQPEKAMPRNLMQTRHWA